MAELVRSRLRSPRTLVRVRRVILLHGVRTTNQQPESAPRHCRSGPRTTEERIPRQRTAFNRQTHWAYSEALHKERTHSGAPYRASFRNPVVSFAAGRTPNERTTAERRPSIHTAAPDSSPVQRNGTLRIGNRPAGVKRPGFRPSLLHSIASCSRAHSGRLAYDPAECDLSKTGLQECGARGSCKRRDTDHFSGAWEESHTGV